MLKTMEKTQKIEQNNFILGRLTNLYESQFVIIEYINNIQKHYKISDEFWP